MSVTVIDWPAATAAPSSVSEPEAGSAVMSTETKLLAGSSLASLNPKSSAAKETAVSSVSVMLASVPAGASATDVTLTSNDRLLMSPSFLVV